MASPLRSRSGKILIATGLALTVLLIYQMFRTHKVKKKKLSAVADEGYETAEDILFPKRRFMRLG